MYLQRVFRAGFVLFKVALPHYPKHHCFSMPKDVFIIVFALNLNQVFALPLCECSCMLNKLFGYNIA